MHIVASYGGKFDSLIERHNLRYCKVVNSVEAAGDLPLDDDDTHAYTYTGNFALLLHGTQPAGSQAAKDWHKIKSSVGGYKSDYFAHYEKG